MLPKKPSATSVAKRSGYRFLVDMSKPKSGSFNYRLSVVIGTDIKSNYFLKSVVFTDRTSEPVIGS